MDGLFHGKSQSKMDDLGVPPYLETPTCTAWIPISTQVPLLFKRPADRGKSLDVGKPPYCWLMLVT